jgi:Nif-specific regulatory protein
MRRDRSIQFVYEAIQMLEHASCLDQKLPRLLELMAVRLGHLRCALTLFNRQRNEIVIDIAYGHTAAEQARGRYALGEGITGRVVASGEAAVVPRISEAPTFLNRTGAQRGLEGGDTSFICVPIKSRGATSGTLSAERPFHSETPLEDDVQTLSVLASMIAGIVEARRHERETREQPIESTKIIGTSKAMRRTVDMIQTVAPSDATVLIRGESGVGKELVAEAIHANSRRREFPLIKVNCAALPSTIIESELFGHEKGAFTGALNTRKGRFELANGGTIFLDEIGDFAPATQITLLRIIQEREFERVGGNETHRTDVRIIAATNRDLEKLMQQEVFRQDLYYRLNVFPIHVPPLRDRSSDVLLLADYFVERYAAANHKTVSRISTPAIDMLLAYHWPGNVRELENCIERAVLLTNEGVIHSHHLPPTLQTAESSNTQQAQTLQATLERIERDMIMDALKGARGNMASAARALGLSERVMGLRVRKFGIDTRRFRAGSEPGRATEM